MNPHSMDEIAEICAKYRLPYPMTVPVRDPSAFMFPMGLQAQDLCQLYGARFVFLESPTINAVALQDTDFQMVGVHAGMFWMLSRIAARVVRSGAFVNVGRKPEPVWNPGYGRTSVGPRALLDDMKPFDWQAENADIADDPDRTILFLLILRTLFFFVVLHEIGHLSNDHGLRRKSGTTRPLMIDGASATKGNNGHGTASHAREMIADGFAFLATIRLTHQAATDARKDKVLHDWHQKIMPTNADLTRVVLLIVDLYFRMTDQFYNSDHQLLDRTHPPAPFRLKGVLATVLENPPLGTTEAEIAKILNGIVGLGDAVASIALDIFPNPDWLTSISTRSFDSHFQAIYSAVPDWWGKIGSKDAQTGAT